MDFIIGMFLIVFVLIMLINFASISVSDTPSVNGQCAIGGGLFNIFGQQQVPTTTMVAGGAPEIKLNDAMRNNVVGRKMGYDYANYFFM